MLLEQSVGKRPDLHERNALGMLNGLQQCFAYLFLSGIHYVGMRACILILFFSLYISLELLGKCP